MLMNRQPAAGDEKACDPRSLRLANKSLFFNSLFGVIFRICLSLCLAAGNSHSSNLSIVSGIEEILEPSPPFLLVHLGHEHRHLRTYDYALVHCWSESATRPGPYPPIAVAVDRRHYSSPSVQLVNLFSHWRHRYLPYLVHFPLWLRCHHCPNWSISHIARRERCPISSELASSVNNDIAQLV